MRNKIKILLVLITITQSSLVFSFNTSEMWDSMLNSRPGVKNNANEENIDLSEFEKPDQCKRTYPWGAPRIKDKVVNGRSLYLCNEGFSVQFDPKTKVPLWTSEVLTADNIEHPLIKYKDGFKVDPAFPKGIQLNDGDFGSEITQGTLSSPINQTFTIEDEEVELAKNKKAQREAHYYTNVFPINNNGALQMWNQAAYDAKSMTPKMRTLFVTSGVLFLNGKTNGETKSSQAKIPTHMYKIITDPQYKGTVSYIIPNKVIYYGQEIKNIPKQDIYFCNNGPCTLNDFIVTIKEVERVSGIEFYPDLAPHYAVQVKLDISELLKNKKRKLEKIQDAENKNKTQ